MTQATAMIKKSFKYLLLLILTLLLVVLGLLVFILHTETGTRLAVEQGIKWAEVDVKYDQLTGNLANGMMINNFRYVSHDIDIKVNKISYQSNWSWFNRHLELNQTQIDNVLIQLKPSSTDKPATQPFSGLTLPLSLDINDMAVNQLTWQIDDKTIQVEQQSGNSLNNITQLTINADVYNDSASINTLSVDASEYGFNVSGNIDFSNTLAYDLEAEWQLQNELQNMTGKGKINGNLNQFELDQGISIAGQPINGDIKLTGQISEFAQNPRLDLMLMSDQIDLLMDQQNTTVNQFQAGLQGVLDDYDINVNAEVAGAKLIQSNESKANSTLEPQSISYPNSQIKITATGDSQGIRTETAQLITPEGRIDLKTVAQWQPSLNINSELKLVDFNPQQIIQNWPGIINGVVNFEITSSDQGINISTFENQLTGKLKDQSLNITGAVNYGSDTLSAKQLRIQLGDNFVVVEGQVKPNNVNLKADVNWLDLSVISDSLSGEIKGNVELTGDYESPQLKMLIQGKQLVFDGYQIAQLSIDSQGQWNQDLKSKVVIEQAILAGQPIETINIDQQGWLDNHQVELNLESNDISTHVVIQGRYQTVKSATNDVVWQGQLLKHQLTVENDKTINLKQPIGVEFGELLSIEKGCWQGVEAGSLCLELNQINKNKHFAGALTVNQFSLVPFQMLLPANTEIKGMLNGAADFQIENNNISIESNINLQEGEIIVSEPVTGELQYQSNITTFEIDAVTENKDIDISLRAELTDKSYVDLSADLDSSDEQIQINSTFAGKFNNTELIKNLTAEVSDMEGQIVFEGVITGALSKPRINVGLSQPEGFVTLTRLGTVIEDLQLTINTENFSMPLYAIKLSGNNLTSINRGSIELVGELSFNELNQWNYQGKITGDNFMLLNLSEAKFNISPDLNIKANHELTEINGALDIDSGRVKVEQLPTSTVQISNDVVIHRTDSDQPNKYPVVLDIKANIVEPIELDVIGLQSGLTGSIQLTQEQNQALSGQGILNLTDGTYEIYGQELTINRGELNFTGPIDNPRLNVRASRESYSGDVLAGVELGGTVNNLRSTLFSEPSLADVEKLSYIMTGRGTDNSGGLDGEKLQQAAIVMGLNQSSPVFRQIQSQFGIDVFTVREAATTADTVVEAGKKINDRLYVSYNQGLFNRLGFWLLKYKINDFLNLETTQGDDQSVSLVYTRKADIKKPKQKDQ